MSYGIMPYSINLDTLEKYYGTDDQQLINNIIKSSKGRLDRLDDDFEEEDGWQKAETILSDFLNGKLEVGEGNSAKHWYILEILIEGFGSMLNNGNWYPASIDDLYDYSELQMFLVSKTGKFKLPSPDDFPTSFTIQNKNLSAAAKEIESSDYDAAQKSEFQSWIATAQQNDQDLVLFYY
ncbi:MAG: hypothetical protein MI810_11485 [Flavobacteriales bacterium]|nr:hypothetical protein [Flavobacteriales bacterium]